MRDIVLKIGSVLKENFTPLLLCLLFLTVLGFITLMSHVHNDSLAAKGCGFADGILGAILLASRGVRSAGGNQGGQQ